MEWVETTGKTVEEARERALEELGVAEDEAEIDVLDEPKAGLFGLIRGEARIRARVRPAEVRPKVERRRGRRKESRGGDTAGGVGTVDDGSTGDESESEEDAAAERPADAPVGNGRDGGRGRAAGRDDAGRGGRRRRNGEDDDSGEAYRGGDDEPVEPAAVGAAAVAFMEGLVDAFDLEASVELDLDGTELDVRVQGSEVGLLIGPGGRTLLAVQDLARVAAQRRLGDHETRLRIDVAGYRERRREALERFARTVADQVIQTGRARSLEPMPSADRKVVHDVLLDVEGVSSHSEGDDPDRRVVVTPS